MSARTWLVGVITEALKTYDASKTVLLNLNCDAVLGGDIAGLGEVEDGAHGGESRDSKRVDPRLRLVDYREVDGHRRTFIDGVAEPLVRGGDPARSPLDGSAVNGDAAHNSSPSGSGSAAGTADAPTGTVGEPSTSPLPPVAVAPGGGRTTMRPQTLRSTRPAPLSIESGK